MHDKVAPVSKGGTAWLYVLYVASILRMLCWGVFGCSFANKSLFVHSSQLHLWASRTLLRACTDAEKFKQHRGCDSGWDKTFPLFAAKHLPATG